MAKDPKICSTPHCKNKKVKYRKVCHRCKTRAWRKKFPMRAAYLDLKSNSKRRKIFFDLTFEQFRDFAIEVKLLTRRGRDSQSYTVDRIVEGPVPGYTAGNLQRLTKAENSVKEIARRKAMSYDYQHKTARYY